MAGTAFVAPRAAWRVMLDGADLTDRYAPRLVSLRLSEKLGEEADELEIGVDDSDGAFQPPRQGATLAVALGWERGSGVAVGLVDKGTFTVDEVSWAGPPDKVTITARSADLKGGFRTRRTRTMHDTTIGAVVAQVAADNGLTPRCHPDLADRPVAVFEQHNKSDMQALRDLGRHHDATATVKAGCLIFAPRGASTTASGKALPSVVIDRAQCDAVSWRRASRDKDQNGAEAQYHDPADGRRKTEQAGGTRKKRLKQVYANRQDAQTAAQSETNRLNRASATLEVTLSLGDATIAPGQGVTAIAFRPHIDQQQWRIASTEHTIDAGRFSTRIEMEVAG